ncbi:MAG TPA: CBS domain-containing protein [Candidatus Polarisedimenticolia bacterium]|nr:CBS domain-containing protein [Candidatus Polarisedimenticolia bacterium]
MTAGELMNRTFETVQADARLEDVARKLQTSGPGLLPVCQDGILVGTITTHDILHREDPLPRRRGESLRVADVIAPDLLFCFESTEVSEAANLMRENHVRMLPVLSPSKTVVGMLALDSIPSEEAV